MDWLKAIAPTIATVLGGPLAGLAVEALGSALGVPAGAVKDIVQSGNMTGDQIAAVKQAELALQAKLAELKIKADEIAVDNTKSAREMQVATRSKVPGVLATLVTVGFFGILIGMMSGQLKTTNSEALLIMLGALSAAWGGVVNYYFGSSVDSARKTDMLGTHK